MPLSVAVDIGRCSDDQCNYPNQSKQNAPHLVRARREVADVSLGVQAPLKPLLAIVFDEGGAPLPMFEFVVHKQHSTHKKTRDGEQRQHNALVHQRVSALLLM
jgi:hypothetical protein